MRFVILSAIFVWLVSKGVGIGGLSFFVIIAWLWSKGSDFAEKERIEKEEQERIRAEEYRLKLEQAIEQERIVEQNRIKTRDANAQDWPYTYKCVGHPNATLAIRYGIANLSNIRNVPADTIQLQKIRKVKDDSEGSHYLAKLVDFGKREVIVVIKPGTEYVQTFYPMSEDWFKKYADLELVLKDNSTFSLKELANFHVQKVVINS